MNKYAKVLNIYFHFCFPQKNRHSKLEKADILEMTVRFLNDIPPAGNKSEYNKLLFHYYHY